MDEYRYVVNAEAAVYRDGEYLLARRSADEDHAAGTWSLIGGKVESVDVEGDVLRETVRREVKEEVGVDVGDLRYVESGGFVADEGSRVVNAVFLGAYAGGEARVREPEEVGAVEWVDADRLDDLDVPPFVAAYLESIDELRRGLGW